mmetsp:Transcript_25075/g.56885  ORF Transcript_25075/g.56885 Transcript_25075/m.56885 type:complete len:97 (+) Transcript_25075:73-363(+)
MVCFRRLAMPLFALLAGVLADHCTDQDECECLLNCEFLADTAPDCASEAGRRDAERSMFSRMAGNKCGVGGCIVACQDACGHDSSILRSALRCDLP